MKSEHNYHAGHRSRVREKFLCRPLEAFLPHEVLELLLFYTIPYRDTNVMGHQLMEGFGTLGGILDAAPDRLCSVEGVGQSTVGYFALLREVVRRCTEGTRSEAVSYENYRVLGEYLTGLWCKAQQDSVWYVALNNRFELLTVSPVCHGRCTSPAFSARSVAEPLLLQGAAMVALVTCRGEGSLKPDENEISVTVSLASELSLVGIKLLEHFIVTPDHYVGVSTRIPGGLESAPGYEEFYRSRRESEEAKQ